MLLAFGCAVVQASRIEFATRNPMDPELDDLDDQWAAQNKLLYEELQEYLANATVWLKWQFSDRLNNHCGLLQFHTSRNHENPEIRNLAEFLAQQSPGTYGLIYVHSEDRQRMSVLRILGGRVSQHQDNFFSPFANPDAFGDLLRSD